MNIRNRTKKQSKYESTISDKEIGIHNILTSLTKVKILLDKKNYRVKKIYEKLERGKLTFAINFSEIEKHHINIPLPKNYNWWGYSYPLLSEQFNHIVYNASLPTTEKELKVLVDELTRWVKALPKLIEYRITILPFEIDEAKEAEEIFDKELKFDIVFIDPAEDEDEIYEGMGMYYLEGRTYIPKSAEDKFEKMVEDIVSSRDCFSSMEWMYRF